MALRHPPELTLEPDPALPDVDVERVPGLDVVEDARRRERRHRLAGACLLSATVAVGAGIAAIGGGGGGRTRAMEQVAHDGAARVENAIVHLPRGRATGVFTISAPAGHAYDVELRTPGTAVIVLAMRIAAGTGWMLRAPLDGACRTTSGRTSCILRFAAGGNPGGTWTGVVTKPGGSAVTVRIAVAFNRHRGDYSG